MFGTSWWADTMYLPVLTGRDDVSLAALLGRDPDRTTDYAQRWGFEASYTDPARLFAEQQLDAVIIATPNVSHHPLATAALEHGAAVLCEKPLALDFSQAADLADLAAGKGAVTMVPFTYRFMPAVRHLHDLFESGYLGEPYHVNLRYYSGGARDSGYSWRFDTAEAGPGILGDLGSHFIYLARWFFGEVTEVSAMLGWRADRPHPQGRVYEQGDDVALLHLRFANGALGSITASGIAHEPAGFDQRQEMELHGSEGTLRHRIDWESEQQIWGARRGDARQAEIEIPEPVWGGAPRDDVVATFTHVFHEQGLMVGEFLDGAAAGTNVSPDFADGAAVQAIIDAAWRSHHERRWVPIDEIAGIG